MPEDLLTRSVNVGFSGGEKAQRYSANGGAGAGTVHS
jgi:Fe-S cluster assembly ATPase SufC